MVLVRLNKPHGRIPDDKILDELTIQVVILAALKLGEGVVKSTSTSLDVPRHSFPTPKKDKRSRQDSDIATKQKNHSKK